jgi:hypothetical protein
LTKEAVSAHAIDGLVETSMTFSDASWPLGAALIVASSPRCCPRNLAAGAAR